MLKSYIVTENVKLQEDDIAMHFFSGLDPARYSGMKTMMHNMMTSGTRDPLPSVNEVYQIAANWVKTQPVSKPGQGTTFVMAGLDKPAGKSRGSKRSDVASDKLQHITCFAYGEKGHYANKYPNNRKSDTTTEELTGDDADSDV